MSAPANMFTRAHAPSVGAAGPNRREAGRDPVVRLSDCPSSTDAVNELVPRRSESDPRAGQRVRQVESPITDLSGSNDDRSWRQ